MRERTECVGRAGEKREGGGERENTDPRYVFFILIYFLLFRWAMSLGHQSGFQQKWYSKTMSTRCAI